MSRKSEITKYIAQTEGLDIDEITIRKIARKLWQNPRPKPIGGLKLTDIGFEILSKHFTAHQVRFENRIELKFTNQMILRLDNFITCPWYITKMGMWVFDDKMAVQLVLFSGNIEKFTNAKARSLDISQS